MLLIFLLKKLSSKQFFDLSVYAIELIYLDLNIQINRELSALNFSKNMHYRKYQDSLYLKIME